jgi:hypothetical protein
MGSFNLIFLMLIVGLFIVIMVAVMRHSLRNQRNTVREVEHEDSYLYLEAVRIVRSWLYNPAIPKPINGHDLLRILTPALDTDTALEAIAEGVDGKKDLIIWDIKTYDTED